MKVLIGELKTVRIEMVCECGGRMRSSGVGYGADYADPAEYLHRCEKCGRPKIFKHEYPGRFALTPNKLDELKGLNAETFDERLGL